MNSCGDEEFQDGLRRILHHGEGVCRGGEKPWDLLGTDCNTGINPKMLQEAEPSSKLQLSSGGTEPLDFLGIKMLCVITVSLKSIPFFLSVLHISVLPLPVCTEVSHLKASLETPFGPSGFMETAHRVSLQCPLLWSRNGAAGRWMWLQVLHQLQPGKDKEWPKLSSGLAVPLLP